MRWTVRFEVEISANLGGFPVNLVANVVPLLMTRTSRKGIALSELLCIVIWMEGLDVLR
jgi:hypothetical protein